MKQTIMTLLLAFVAYCAFAYENEDFIDGTFSMTVNSIKDDEFEFDETGVWLNNCEIIVTIHLNPDSILDIYEKVWDGYSVFPSTIVLNENNFIENYGDSVKRYLAKELYDCDDEIWLYIRYGSRYNAEGQQWLKSETFKVIDYVRNEDCRNAYNTATSIETPVSLAENKKQYFDLSGRKINGPLPHGIYIVGGKKVLK